MRKVVKKKPKRKVVAVVPDPLGVRVVVEVECRLSSFAIVRELRSMDRVELGGLIGLIGPLSEAEARTMQKAIAVPGSRIFLRFEVEP